MKTDVSPCRSCGVDTTPCTGKRGCRHKGRWEWYMVRDAIWRAVGGGEGFLCIACLEGKLGRPLNRTDFTDAPVNDFPDDPWCTDRLRAALLRPAPGPAHQLRTTTVKYLASAKNARRDLPERTPKQ